MSFVFRSIGNKHWYSDNQPDFSEWLPDGELVADALKELRTTRGSLSVYIVDTNKGNLDRVLSAYACTRNSVNDIDYVLMPLEVIEATFEIAPTSGQTADDEVNKAHLDIERLSASKLLLLAHIFQDYHSSMYRIRKKQITARIRNSLMRKYLDFSRINRALQSKFSEFSAS